MDGGHKSTMSGLTSIPDPAPPPQLRSELHSANWRMGQLFSEHVKVFQIESTLNTDTFPRQFAFLQKREWEWSPRDRATYLATAKSLERVPPRLARSVFHGINSPQRMTSVQAGEVESVHERTIETC